MRAGSPSRSAPAICSSRRTSSTIPATQPIRSIGATSARSRPTGAAVEQAARLGVPHVLDGFNVDDRGDHRPGRRAAIERGVRSPLDELGFTKVDIREAARRIGLPVWDKPALACLSSRFPYGTEITTARLEQVGRCERVLRAQGFKVCRVRYYGEVARIEVAPEEIHRLLGHDLRALIVTEFRDAGFQQVHGGSAGLPQRLAEQGAGKRCRRRRVAHRPRLTVRAIGSSG